MKTHATIAAACLLAACLAPGLARSEEQKPAAAPKPSGAQKPGTVHTTTTPKGVMHEQVTTLSAKVEAIDQEKRLVTLRGPQGHVVEIEAGPQVKNLAQVKPGDTVVIKYHEAIAFDLKTEAGQPEAAAAGLTARSAPGEKPAAGAAKILVADVTVEAIDPKTMMVTVKGPNGNLWDVKARDPKRLQMIKVGDQITVTYTQAVAISVEAAQN